MNVRKQRSIRLTPYIDQELQEKAELFGYSVSQFIELACYYFLDEEIEIRKPATEQMIRDHQLSFSLKVDVPTYKKLLEASAKNNSSLSQEIRFRLANSLTYPVFSEAEHKLLRGLWADLNRLGNLFKFRVENTNDETKIMHALYKKLHDVQNELMNLVEQSKARQF